MKNQPSQIQNRKPLIPSHLPTFSSSHLLPLSFPPYTFYFRPSAFSLELLPLCRAPNAESQPLPYTLHPIPSTCLCFSGGGLSPPARAWMAKSQIPESPSSSHRLLYPTFLTHPIPFCFSVRRAPNTECRPFPYTLNPEPLNPEPWISEPLSFHLWLLNLIYPWFQVVVVLVDT